MIEKDIKFLFVVICLFGVSGQLTAVEEVVEEL